MIRSGSNPAIVEGFEPERITLKLSTEKIDDKKSAIKIGDKKSAIKIGDKKSAVKESIKIQIIEFLTDYAEAKTSEIAEYIGLKPSRTRDYLKELISENIVVAEGANRNRIYRLKA